MLRIYFTSGDLVRTHVAETPDPLWEIVLSIQMLRARYGRIAFAEWRSGVVGELRRNDLAAAIAEKLVPLVPDAGYFPDFLTPPEGTLGLEAGLEAIAATDRSRIRGELTILGRRSGTPGWAWNLTDRGQATRDELIHLLKTYHRCALAPYWMRLCDRIDADRAVRVRTLRTQGIGALFDGFAPMMRWRPPVLEVDKRSVDRDLHLGGRGLLMLPAYFCWYRPICLADPSLPPVLVYPVRHDPRWLDPAATTAAVPNGAPLARLLGPTRAAILRASVSAPNTTEIARRLAVSPASVSGHTAVLREARLIVSRRHANSVLHLATPLGRALLKESGYEEM